MITPPKLVINTQNPDTEITSLSQKNQIEKKPALHKSYQKYDKNIK